MALGDMTGVNVISVRNWKHPVTVRTLIQRVWV